jgi:hypothetical protein
MTFFQQIALSLFDEGRASGILEAMDSAGGLQFTTGAVAAVVQGHLAGTFSMREEEIERTVECCWRAITRTPS